MIEIDIKERDWIFQGLRSTMIIALRKISYFLFSFNAIVDATYLVIMLQENDGKMRWVFPSF